MHLEDFLIQVLSEVLLIVAEILLAHSFVINLQLFKILIRVIHLEIIFIGIFSVSYYPRVYLPV